MKDADVRGAVMEMLEDQHGGAQDTLIVQELGLLGRARADVTVINGSLHGMELKSAADTLSRLPNQVETYSRVFDRVTLFVAGCHHDAAVELIPTWWGVSCVSSTDGDLSLTETRLGATNPAVDPVSLAWLLWRGELLGLLERRGLDAGFRSATRRRLVGRVAEALDLDDLRCEVRSLLKARPDWR